MEPKDLITDGSIFKKVRWGSNNIVVRALSLIEMEWWDREFRLYGMEPNNLDYLILSILVWSGEWVGDFSVGFRREIAAKFSQLPADRMDVLHNAYVGVQKAYFEMGQKMHVFFKSEGSRALWEQFKVHEGEIFKKIHFWNDYQSDWIIFNRREDANFNLDFIFSGFKLLVGCWSKVPKELESFSLSQLSSRSSSLQADLDDLDEIIRNEVAGVKDRHSEIMDRAEAEYEELVKRREQEALELQQAARKRVDDSSGNLPSILHLSPEEIVVRSKEKYRGR